MVLYLVILSCQLFAVLKSLALETSFVFFKTWAAISVSRQEW